VLQKNPYPLLLSCEALSPLWKDIHEKKRNFIIILFSLNWSIFWKTPKFPIGQEPTTSTKEKKIKF
jgi:hypothetical protein